MSSPRQLDNSMFATSLLLRQETEEAKVVDCIRTATQGFAIGGADGLGEALRSSTTKVDVSTE